MKPFKPSTAWVVIILFFSDITGGFFILKEVTSGSPQDFSLSTTTGPSATSGLAQGLTTPQISKDYKEYHNNKFTFSVSYPADLPPKEYTTPDPNELTIAFQAEQGREGFQIYLAPIEGNKITQERFLRDEASGVRNDPVNTTIAGVPALAFHGFDAAMGQTYEVWFIRGGFLYEVSTYKQLEPWLNDIMSTWRFF